VGNSYTVDYAGFMEGITMGFIKVLGGFPIIRTERLVLREIVMSDVNDVFACFSDDDVIRYLDFHSFREIDAAKGFVRRMSWGFEKKEIIRWAITLKDEDRLIGTCFLSDFVEGSLAVLGYDLSKSYWGKGIMTEALKSVIPFGFDVLGLHKIQAIVNPLNIASASLLRRMGFQEGGLPRKYEYHYDRENFNNVLMFSLLKEEYEKVVNGHAL
jgi:ribosomal-protein-alanine N-acetyltransferase